jgi:hypothetical protein
MLLLQFQPVFSEKNRKILLLNAGKYDIIAFVEVTCERARAECYEYQAPWSSG